MSFFFFSSRRRHTRLQGDWSSDVCSSDPSRRRHTRLQGDWSSDVCSSDRSEEHTSELQSPCNLVCRIILLDARATLAQRRQLMVLGGWASLLAACVHVDLGQREAAYARRLTAQRIGVQTESGELAAWAFEIGAWQALLDGHYDEAVSLCQAGQRLVGTGTSAYVQLTAQEARAWARQKQERETRAAVDRSAAAFAQMPPAGQSDHHFT